jgi:hypothetical protein
MKFLSIISLIFASQSFAMGGIDYDVTQFQNNLLEDGACEYLDLTEGQQESIKHIFTEAREQAKEIMGAIREIHTLYSENLRSEEGSFEAAATLGDSYSDVAMRGAQLKMTVINSILFKVMDGRQQRILAARCMHERRSEKP